MDGLHSAAGKRTRNENEFAENNDRNKRRNSRSGREQALPGADSTVYHILCPGNVVRSNKISDTRDAFEDQSCRCCSKR
jgi:hypothetical protein